MKEVCTGESGRVSPKFGSLGPQVYQTRIHWYDVRKYTVGQLNLNDGVD
jgi:hypothetical protein